MPPGMEAVGQKWGKPYAIPERLLEVLGGSGPNLRSPIAKEAIKRIRIILLCALILVSVSI